MKKKVISSIKLHQIISLRFDKDRTNHMLCVGKNIMLNDVSDFINKNCQFDKDVIGYVTIEAITRYRV